MRKKGLKGLGSLLRGSSLMYHTRMKKGEDLLLQGKYERALKTFDEAAELNPREAMPWFNRGIALGELGQNGGGKGAYRGEEVRGGIDGLERRGDVPCGL
jgi:tetratricopeptide (TPR) repeat protein